jgi:hypothetical protein
MNRFNLCTEGQLSGPLHFSIDQKQQEIYLDYRGRTYSALMCKFDKAYHQPSQKCQPLRWGNYQVDDVIYYCKEGEPVEPWVYQTYMLACMPDKKNSDSMFSVEYD